MPRKKLTVPSEQEMKVITEMLHHDCDGKELAVHLGKSLDTIDKQLASARSRIGVNKLHTLVDRLHKEGLLPH